MKRTPTQIPPGGMGNGLERAYSKNSFIYYWLQYQWTKILENFLVLIHAETKILQLYKNFKNFVTKGRPLGGFERSQKPLWTEDFFYFCHTY